MRRITIYSAQERQVSAIQLRGLYDEVQWWPERDKSSIAEMLQHGPYVSAWSGEVLVGFCRAITDGVFRAYIEDMAVRPGFQRKGIGTMLLDKMMGELRDIHIVSLFCSQELTAYYSLNHFKATKQVVMHRS